MTEFTRGMMLVLAIAATAGGVTRADAPNLLVIMTDNHGAWTLGCYGNPELHTPHIDQLADEGMRFRQAFAVNPVCSPTRATFLTGLLPSQHGVHCFLRANRLQIGPESRNTLAEFTSLPEILRQSGYRCGLVGKWHLGDNLHPQEGFDDYWVTMPHGATRTFYGAEVIEDGVIRTEPSYLTDFWTEHAVRFLEQSRETPDQPFFLFLSYNGPYALGRLLLKDSQNRHAARYADAPLTSFPRTDVHPWQHHNRDYINNPVSIRRVAAEVSGVDDGVGRVLAALDRLQLTDDTLVVFLADQGWVGGHGGFWGMGDHTDPVTARDGMMRIPLIVRYPGRVPAGTTSDRLVAEYDLLPTLLDLLQPTDRTLSVPQTPGVSFADTLTDPHAAGRSPAVDPAAAPTEDSARDPDEDPAIVMEFEILRAIRTRRWKYVHRHPNGPHELFDLSSDPQETRNLAESPDHRVVRDRLRQRLEAFFAQHADPRYDIYRGGGSQTVRYTGR